MSTAVNAWRFASSMVSVFRAATPSPIVPVMCPITFTPVSWEWDVGVQDSVCVMAF
jgi:hypothetical protein